MSADPSPAVGLPVRSCDACGTELAPALLSCPVCHRLVHAERLRILADSAEAAERAGQTSQALQDWRQAIELLPSGTRQHTVISERIARLTRQVEAGGLPGEAARNVESAAAASDTTATGQHASSGWSKGAASGVLGTLALAAWKFKFLAFVVLSKAKLLLLGLTKASTFFSMFAMVGVYWTQFGFWFALGLVLSLYIHEMGHVVALTRYGIAASAPLFIPGVGALIRVKQAFGDPRVDARVGLAGPIWGLGAAAFCALMFALTQEKLWAAVAHIGALLNLFNLIPIWQLDGGRAFRTLNRPQRWLAATAWATAWAITENGLVMLLMLVAAARAFVDKPSDRPDRGALVQYIFLVAALSFLSFSPYFRAG
jgi:Zn-dependent protease